MLPELAATVTGEPSAVFVELFGPYAPTIVQLLQIVAIDILLAGDNAVVIALACRALPQETRWIGIALGVLAAIVLRVVFTLGLQAVLNVPYLMLVGGLLLFYIALQLLGNSHGGGHDQPEIKASTSVWGAVRTVALADAVMSLDNVIAVAGAAQGHPWLIVFGLLLSIPLIVGGAALVIALLTRYPVLVWAGAALLGWIAGELIAKEKAMASVFQPIYQPWGLSAHGFELACAVIGAALVVLMGLVLRARQTAPSAEGKH